MKRLLAFILAFTAVLAVHALVFAEPAASAVATPGIPSLIVGWVVVNIFPLIASAIGVTLTAIFGKVGVPAIFNAMILKVANSAVHSMEERAAQWAKTMGSKMDSNVKFVGAVDYVTKWTGISNNDAKDVVNAALGAIPDVGASAKVLEGKITEAISKPTP